MPTIKTTSQMKVDGVTYLIKDDVARTELASEVAAREATDASLAALMNAENTAAGVHRDLKTYLWKDKCYMSPDGQTFTPNDDMCVCRISLQRGDIVYLKAKSESVSPWENVGMQYRAIALVGSTYTRLDQATPVGSTADYEIIAIGRPNVKRIYLQLLRDRFDDLEFWLVRSDKNSMPYTVSEKDVIRQITVSNAIPVDSFWMSWQNDAVEWRNMDRHQETIPVPLCMYLPLKAGQKITGDRVSTGYNTIGVYNSTDGDTYLSIGSEFTAPEDGFACIYRNRNDLNEVLEFPVRSIKIKYSDVLDPPEGRAQILDGKTIAAFGDSITAQNLWEPMVKSVLGGTWVNCGIGSTPLSGDDTRAFWQDARLNTVKATNPDLVTILGGANDLVYNPVIGDETNLEDKDTDTFIGAYSYIIDTLKTWKPSLQIVILSTTWAHNDGRRYSETVTYGDFARACKLVAEYYHLPFVDLYGESGFNQYTMGENVYRIYSTDQIHPNQEGAKIIASMVAAKIREIYSM